MSSTITSDNSSITNLRERETVLQYHIEQHDSGENVVEQEEYDNWKLELQQIREELSTLRTNTNSGENMHDNDDHKNNANSNGMDDNDNNNDINTAQNKDNTHDTADGPKPLKRPPTAYFLFMNENRKELMDANPGKSVGVIGKLLGEKWKLLTDQEKQQFQDRCKILKQQYDEHVKQNPELYKKNNNNNTDNKDTNDNGEVDELDALCANLFPAANVLRIIKLDPDTKKVSKEASLLLNKAAEQFIIYLVKTTHQAAAFQGKKTSTMKFPEFYSNIKNNSKLEFLRQPMKKFLQQQENIVKELEKKRKEEREKRKLQLASMANDDENNDNNDNDNENDNEDENNNDSGNEEMENENNEHNSQIENKEPNNEASVSSGNNIDGNKENQQPENSNTESATTDKSKSKSPKTNKRTNNATKTNNANKKSKKSSDESTPNATDINNKDDKTKSKAAPKPKPKPAGQNIATMFSKLASAPPKNPQQKLTKAPDAATANELLSQSQPDVNDKIDVNNSNQSDPIQID